MTQKDIRQPRSPHDGDDLPYLEDYPASMDGDDYFSADDDDDDEDSQALSVPTTVLSAGDERPATSIMAQKESQRVFYSKLMVISVFLLVSVVVSVAIYGFAQREETEDFKREFASYADKILDLSTINIMNLFEQLDALGISFTGYAIGTEAVWPFLTILNFEAQAGHFLHQVGGAHSISLSMMVPNDQRTDWEKYSVDKSSDWIGESVAYSNIMGMKNESNKNDSSSVIVPSNTTMITPYIFRKHKTNGTIYNDMVPADFYAPIWQASPASQFVDKVNHNSLDDPVFADIMVSLAFGDEPSLIAISPPTETLKGGDGITNNNAPQSVVALPLYQKFQDTSSMVAVLVTRISWHSFFEDILEEGVDHIDFVIEDTCGQSYLYEMHGPNITYIGEGDDFFEDRPHKNFGVSSTSASSFNLTNGCPLQFHFYPSVDLVAYSSTNKPWVYTTTVMVIFATMGVFFVIYDRLAATSYNHAITQVTRSKNIDDSIFPSNVRDRLMDFDEHVPGFSDPMERSRHGSIIGKPIADLHPNCTVLFADIAGFTAWSSVREPSQVFTLLETLFGAYDKIAKKYRIFKVETIGDCYVAVAGLPVARVDHAVSMARFAQDSLIQMQRVVKHLEVMLGPDTGDLAIRIGMHSGPVTAGVLRGEKSRFQLFGDTVNTAARMESTGERNQIQVSIDTAELIKDAGKSHWLTARDDMVSVKGKGEMKTFWLTSIQDSGILKTGSSPANASPQLGPRDASMLVAGGSLSYRDVQNLEISLRDVQSVVSTDAGRKERLINWSADLLLGLLKRIVAMRESEETMNEQRDFQKIVKGLDESGGITTRTMKNIDGGKRPSTKEPTKSIQPGMTVLDEVKEIITLPRKVHKYQQDPGNVQLSGDVVRQLYRYIREICHMYQKNPFHNFEHASHVTQSLTKLLSRVVTEDTIDYNQMAYKKKDSTSKLHKFTFGITSDPMTQFAVAFSSLIHDLDHPGVPNAVLVKEETEMATLYRNKSVAEQNSVDLAWNLLMETRFKDLRQCIYTNQSELDRFRQLVVNTVMATDIVDKELGALRKKRWEKAFSKNPDHELDELATDDVNRKATIVIEHLIQAADVAHTMQHWYIYLKWNEKFFHECYQAYLNGRTDTDPSIGWYKGEIGFFDFYIIPLAKKLENCGVFGVSSDECLQYAKQNRSEWERKGKDIVKTYLASYNKKI